MRAKTLEETPSVRCAELSNFAQGGPGRSCDIAGTAEAGPNGALEAPLSKRKCIWYRATITEEY